MKYSLIIIMLLLAPGFSYAQEPYVMFNEIAWMGTTASFNDEWMELYNPTGAFISLQGWTLKTADGKITVKPEGGIEAGGFYLLERTDDASAPGINASLIYKGSLNNTGQHLQLYDDSGVLVDEGNFLQKWPAGDNTTKQTMERVGGNWQTSKDAGGTPGAANGAEPMADSMEQMANSIPAPEAQNPEPILEPVTEKTYSHGIIINEVLPSPEGADETNEWIELYNGTGAGVDIAGWKLQDIDGQKTAYAFPENSILPAYGYLVATRPQTNITLNNDQDSLQLLFPNGTITDSMSYVKAITAKAYAKTTQGWQWTTTPTPGAQNAITAMAAKTKAKTLPTAKKSDTTSSVAALVKTGGAENAQSPWLIFFAAAAIAVISGTIFLAIKLFSNNNHERT
ncbi:MAG TPA: lamin tail domain-containing protein [Negativicutes bacterium]|nr:lamin tail domain-containing protein [Negativicutes bacterium]